MDPKPNINNIDNKASASLNDTFNRRWEEIKQEAAELSILCGAQVAGLIESPTGEVLSFGFPTEESVISKFQSDVADLGKNSETTTKAEKEREKSEKLGFDEDLEGMEDDSQPEIEDSCKNLEKGKEKSEKFWFEEKPEGIEDDPEKLEAYCEAIETLKANLLQHLKNMQQAKQHPPPPSPLPSPPPTPPPPTVDTTTAQCTTPPPPSPQYRGHNST